jgi:hypothetical protein
LEIKMKYALGLILVAVTSSVCATSDTGIITNIFVSASGSVAVKLDGGFPNSDNAGECPSYNGWAGVSASTDPAIKSAMLAAKVSGSNVALSITGCNGGWLNVNAIYVN